LSTTVFVLGVERGMQLIARLPGVEAVVVDDDGRIYYSAGLTQPE
jgi:thiamine biosynthesis lipoprotein